MWGNNDMQGVAREMNDAIDEVQRQSANTSHKTDKVFVLHRFGDDRVPELGPHGHHHQTIQDPHRYRQIKQHKKSRGAPFINKLREAETDKLFFERKQTK